MSTWLLGVARLGQAWQRTWQGSVTRGKARGKDRASVARPVARLGQAWQGLARLGQAWQGPGTRGKARGKARGTRGKDRGKRGKDRGKARASVARPGQAWQGPWQGSGKRGKTVRGPQVSRRFTGRQSEVPRNRRRGGCEAHNLHVCLSASHETLRNRMLGTLL